MVTLTLLPAAVTTTAVPKIQSGTKINTEEVSSNQNKGHRPALVTGECIMSPTCHLPPDHAVLCARYLQQIENGTHKSLAMYPGFNNRDAFPAPSQRTSTPIGHWGREQWTDPRPKTPPAHVSALQHLRTFNTTLSAGLGNLRESLQSTNRGLDSCLSTWDARRSRPRPRSTMK